MINLRTPGPTPCPEDVLQAIGRPMINHRGPEFRDLLIRTHTRLQKIFETKHDVLMMTTSGTGAMEAAVVNTLSPGDKVLVVSIGSFGDRFASIAKTYGAEVTKLDFPWGQVADPDGIRKALRADPAIKAVLVTHNETSTGVTNGLEAIARVVKKEFGKLLIVDAVSSLGCIPLPVDAWDCDVVATASQKGFMVPPGLAFVSVSPAGWEANKTARIPRFYFDFGRHKASMEKGEPPWTPALSLFFGLDIALDKMLQEGLEGVHKRHARIGTHTRQGVKEMGLSLFPLDERYASNTVTAINVPEGLDGKLLVRQLREKHNVVPAGGQAKLEGKIFRLGHMGHVSQTDMDDALKAVGAVVSAMGFKTAAPARRA